MTEARQLIEDQSTFSTPLEFARVGDEIRKLLAGAEYAVAVIGSTDPATRKFVGAGLLAALADQGTEACSRAQCAYLDYGYFDETTHDLKSAEAPSIRASAVQRLSVFGGSLATLHLIAALYDVAPEVRRAAVSALGRVGDPEALGPLHELLAHERSPALPSAIIQDAIQAINSAETSRLSFSAPAGLADESQSEEIEYYERVDFEMAESHLPATEEAVPWLSRVTPVGGGFAAEESRLSREEEALRTAIEMVERRRLEAEAARKQVETDARLRAEREAQARVEAKARLRAEEAERQRLEQAATRAKAEEESRLKAELQARALAEEEVRRLAEEAAQIQTETESLLQARERVAQRREQITRLRAEDERVRREDAVRRQAVAEDQQLAALEQRLTQARQESLERATRAEQLQTQLAEARKIAEGQRIRIEEAEARLRAEHEEQIRLEMEALRKAAEGQRQGLEAAALLRAAQESARVKAAEEARLRDEDERRRFVEAASNDAEAQRQRLTELEALRAQAERESREYAERETQVQAELNSLRQASTTQQQQIAEAAAAHAAAVAELQQAAEAARLQEEQARQQLAASKRQAEADHLRLTELEALRTQAEIESRDRADEAQRRQSELASLRTQAEEDSARLTLEEDELRSALATLTRANEEQRQNLADLKAHHETGEATRLALEAQARDLVAEERRHIKDVRKRAEDEERRLSELRGLKIEAEEHLQELSREAAQIQKALEGLRKTGEEQRRQIDEAARRQAEETQRQLAELTELRLQLAEETRLQNEQVQKLQTEIASQRGLAEEQRRRHAELTALYNAEETAHLEAEEANKIKLSHVEEERRSISAAQKRTEAEERRFGELQIMRAEAERQLRLQTEAAEHEQKLLGELQSQRLQAEQDALRLAQRHDAVVSELESLERAAVEQRQQLEEAEVLRLAAEAELAAMRASVAEESSLRAAREEQMRAEAEELRRAAEQQWHRVRDAEILRSAAGAELRSIEEKATDELRWHAEQEQQLRTEIAELRRTVAAQRLLIEAANSVPGEPEEPVLLIEESPDMLAELQQPEDADDGQEGPALIVEEPVAPEPQAKETDEWVNLDLREPASQLRTLPWPAATATPAVISKPAPAAAPQMAWLEELETIGPQTVGAPVAGSAASESALREQLNSVDAAERAAALVDLARTGVEGAFELITSSFDDSSPQVRNSAARALFDLHPDRAASFTRALREGSAERKRRIGEALAGSGLATSAITGLAGESREKTYTAFSLLFLMSKAGEVQPLIDAVEDHPNLETRVTAVTLLAMSGQPEVDALFRRLAVRGSLPPEVRAAVMTAINQINQARGGVQSAA